MCEESFCDMVFTRIPSIQEVPLASCGLSAPEDRMPQMTDLGFRQYHPCNIGQNYQMKLNVLVAINFLEPFNHKVLVFKY